MNEQERRRMNHAIEGFNELPLGKQNWLCEVARRLRWNEEDFRTYLCIDNSARDKKFFDSLNLEYNMSYYVVSDKQEFLEKFRVYYLTNITSKREGKVFFTKRVVLNDYIKVVDDPNYSMSELTLDNKRLLVYCHKNNCYVTDKQQAWVQGNLFCSDICDRLLSGEKLLILAEYPIREIEDILGQMKLIKVLINKDDLVTHGLYKAKVIGSKTDDTDSTDRDKTPTGEAYV